MLINVVKMPLTDFKSKLKNIYKLQWLYTYSVDKCLTVDSYVKSLND